MSVCIKLNDIAIYARLYQWEDMKATAVRMNVIIGQHMTSQSGCVQSERITPQRHIQLLQMVFVSEPETGGLLKVCFPFTLRWFVLFVTGMFSILRLN